MFEFDRARTPPEPRDAATVIVVRDGPSGLELFCVRRHARSGFLGGAVVFPGGKVDEADSHPSWRATSNELSPRAGAFHPEEHRARAFAVAALRESFEEAAILPVIGGSLDGAATEQLRQELAAGRAASPPLADALARRHLKLDLSSLVAFARWITPTAERRRYDTRFYLLAAPSGQDGRHDDHETTASFWASPRAILARWERGDIQLAPPTSRTVEILTGAKSVETALALARTQPLEPICPCFVEVDGGWLLTLPGDPLHPEPTDAPIAPGQPTRFVMRAGRFVATTA